MNLLFTHYLWGRFHGCFHLRELYLLLKVPAILPGAWAPLSCLSCFVLAVHGAGHRFGDQKLLTDIKYCTGSDHHCAGDYFSAIAPDVTILEDNFCYVGHLLWNDVEKQGNYDVWPANIVRLPCPARHATTLKRVQLSSATQAWSRKFVSSQPISEIPRGCHWALFPDF
ncbi:hypothetical protein EDD15DRAFT_1668494 [Pisolithus albus]|nr:hypothetical protein EDD15DRAFT_1668494 [Pisolithus albus]